MLVEFSVANFRSINERQTFSMAAGSSAARRSQHAIETGNSFASHLLRSACMFGPNAAGKTSLIQALSFFRRFVLHSSKSASDGDVIAVVPFKVYEKNLHSPSDFEIIFIFDGALYQYGFSADRVRVVEEWLFTRSNEKNSRMRTVFQRVFDAKADKYDWDISEDLVKGERETWKKATRPNSLFLSTAVQLNSESLLPPYRWFEHYLRVLSSPDRLDVNATVQRANEHDGKSDILALLRSFDLPIVDFEAKEKELTLPDSAKNIFSKDFLETLNSIERVTDYEVKTFHQAGNDVVSYDLKEESDGTRVIFSLAGPLLDTTENGFTLVVDELHNSLHPLALRFLVELFHDPSVNISGAQLIFTSHDTVVMSRDFLHRDQIWFLDRSELEGTKLTPLSEFDVREMQSFQRAYLGGKFGALPRIRRGQLGAK